MKLVKAIKKGVGLIQSGEIGYMLDADADAAAAKGHVEIIAVNVQPKPPGEWGRYTVAAVPETPKRGRPKKS